MPTDQFGHITARAALHRISGLRPLPRGVNVAAGGYRWIEPGHAGSGLRRGARRAVAQVRCRGQIEHHQHLHVHGCPARERRKREVGRRERIAQDVVGAIVQRDTGRAAEGDRLHHATDLQRCPLNRQRIARVEHRIVAVGKAPVVQQQPQLGQVTGAKHIGPADLHAALADRLLAVVHHIAGGREAQRVLPNRGVAVAVPLQRQRLHVACTGRGRRQRDAQQASGCRQRAPLQETAPRRIRCRRIGIAGVLALRRLLMTGNRIHRITRGWTAAGRDVETWQYIACSCLLLSPKRSRDRCHEQAICHRFAIDRSLHLVSTVKTCPVVRNRARGSQLQANHAVVHAPDHTLQAGAVFHLETGHAALARSTHGNARVDAPTFSGAVSSSRSATLQPWHRT
ncbi:hypothetical protein XTGART2_1018 [Xanthomonas translucens pv. graminis]|nr:hypothetical protein XTG29_00783 [Xanthomonas translucens pv. graminis ART-Xtg29]SBV40329.1 hypothetical protein XTGART2_1018 [Xanthomonas translucens pv. graminis]SBV40600.1 hypothetical protein XTGART9_1004 [Xanthomonas translucens pv. graminis]SBV54418.1 hypothetical protein XTGART10_1030 [Xanthomonas translucens pv. graminis]SBV57873.1 hypothetical protein XTGICMP6431_1031 [Xanthomonas translucens pv. graminis]